LLLFFTLRKRGLKTVMPREQSDWGLRIDRDKLNDLFRITYEELRRLTETFFQAMASTLIFGEKDAVLVDTFMSAKQANAWLTGTKSRSWKRAGAVPRHNLPMNAKTLSTLATAVLVIAVVLLMLRHGLLGNGPIAIAIQVSGLALMVWARITLGLRSFHYAANPTQGGLITSGPYRYIRNPIYSGVLIAMWSGIIDNWSLMHGGLGILATAMLFVRILCEEQLLRVYYGGEYGAYARRTKRLVPYLM
jgi:protein-S-isoprenylcysteine O-methyltransferase Ste14